ncbi:MlaD family protein [Legionella spiritensis]|uniref:ABC transport system periplasmic substrate binding protein n=1 Tax=Legionella spiritensis TaxID=452 RepID=A0A0W0Z5M4_LEGSP|nr:MlaD family protein [Legionella spiritensis]KTD64413.1 ABC transport system periplasmic substrate binding protein [Legionella spiritensis]SNV46021.1 ABC transport system periplasmic substrate binding protein [Legionella spiritensis]VEG91022.1 ABC transport system periplasmic substrate binding protein [Legionella spiritensis]
MESKTNYTMVGLSVLILTSALLASALWLSVGFNQKQYKTYAVYFHEAVSGLSGESPVKFNGVQVGYVKKIALNHVNPQQVRILLAIEEGTPITTSTTATLISQGITGTTYIGLSASSSDLTPLQKKAKEPYPVIPSRPSLFNQLDKVLKDVSENINSVSMDIKKIFDKENTEHLKKTLANLQIFTDTIAENKQSIKESLQHANVLLRNMAKASEQFPEMVKELKNGVHNISAAGTKVSSTMDAGKTALDKLSQQTIPPAVLLLQRLNHIAANLEQVSTQMQRNPSVIIRGTKPPPPGPGE